MRCTVHFSSLFCLLTIGQLFGLWTHPPPAHTARTPYIHPQLLLLTQLGIRTPPHVLRITPSATRSPHSASSIAHPHPHTATCVNNPHPESWIHDPQINDLLRLRTSPINCQVFSWMNTILILFIAFVSGLTFLRYNDWRSHEPGIAHHSPLPAPEPASAPAPDPAFDTATDPVPSTFLPRSVHGSLYLCQVIAF